MDAVSPTRNYLSPNSEDRVRRNVACINCRNSKVRCRTSLVAGQPCQRCAKLELSCVVDKSHKRITKRSKLEQLEQELNSIKQAVGSNPRVNTAEAETRPPRSPRGSYSSYATAPEARPVLPSANAPPLPPPILCSAPAPLPTSAPGSLSQPLQSTPLDGTARRPVKTTPTQARTLGTRLVSGADINWYFDRFLEHFHPFIPVLRKRDPDDCYEACPTLFWTVVYVAARRYCRDEVLFSLATETIARDVWTLPSMPLLRLEELHAMLLVCAYPLPGTRLVTDPSTMLANMCVTACMMQGLHTGSGSHGEFCVGSRQTVSCADEDAAATWMMACILAQRCAVGIGHPPPGTIQFSAAAVRQALPSPSSLVASASPHTDLLAMFDVHRYLNRMHTAIATHIFTTGSVPESVVASWDDELEVLRPVLVRQESDLTRFVMLAAQMEVQTYYFMQSPDPPPRVVTGGAGGTTAAAACTATVPSSPPESVSSTTPIPRPPPSPSVNTVRAMRTATRLISTLLTPSSTPAPFLTHSPHWVTRSIIDAAALLTSALHSHIPSSVAESLLRLLPPPLSEGNNSGNVDDGGDGSRSSRTTDPSLLVQRAHAALTACSVRDTDPPARAAAILEAFWTNRDRMPRSDLAARAWPSRLGAGMTFWCLTRFNQGLKQAKIQCKGLYRGPAPTCQPNAQRTQDRSGGETPQPLQPPTQSDTPGGTDPFQEVDWSLFLDDFGWGGDEPIFMGLA